MLKRVSKGIWLNTKNGRYELRFTYRNPKTGEKSRPHMTAKIKLEDGTIKYAETKDEAILAVSQFIANNGRVDKISVQADKTPFTEALPLYIEYCHSLNKKRVGLIETYCNYFLHFLAEFYHNGDINLACKRIFVQEIKPIDFIRYRSKRQKDKVFTRTKQGLKWTGRYVSNASINREMNSIQGFFSYLVYPAEILEKNPCTPIAPLPIEKKRKTSLTEEQETIILNEAKEDFPFFVMLLLLDTLGPRKGEVYNLKWVNVALESSNIYPNGFVDFVERKNGKDLRLPLSKDLNIALGKLPRLSEYVFTNPKTGTKYVDRKKKLDRILQKAGAKKTGTGYHVFRRTAASNLENSGVEASVIKDVLGNSMSVISTYLNQSAKRLQAVIDTNSERINTNLN